VTFESEKKALEEDFQIELDCIKIRIETAINLPMLPT
jgi:hypothetical protein